VQTRCVWTGMWKSSQNTWPEADDAGTHIAEHRNKIRS
jgi:hypothetical protein